MKKMTEEVKEKGRHKTRARRERVAEKREIDTERGNERKSACVRKREKGRTSARDCKP